MIEIGPNLRDALVGCIVIAAIAFVTWSAMR